MRRIFVAPTRRLLAWIRFCSRKSQEKVESSLGQIQRIKSAEYETFR